MSRIGDNNNPRINQHTTPQTPQKAGYAKMQANSGNVGKVSRGIKGSQDSYKDLQRMYETGHMMQYHQVTEGSEGAPDVHEGFVSHNNTLPF